MRANEEETTYERARGSLTSSIGFALGELLLLADRPGDLARCIGEIQVAAHATLLSSSWVREVERAGSLPLADAGLAVVRAWYAEAKDLVALGEAIATLKDELEVQGVFCVATEPAEAQG